MWDAGALHPSRCDRPVLKDKKDTPAPSGVIIDKRKKDKKEEDSDDEGPPNFMDAPPEVCIGPAHLWGGRPVSER